MSQLNKYHTQNDHALIPSTSVNRGYTLISSLNRHGKSGGEYRGRCEYTPVARVPLPAKLYSIDPQTFVTQRS
jgi:hypothetical protein